MKPLVALLHGLLRSSRSMARLARALEAEGYDTWLGGYPSQTLGIEACARRVAEALAPRAAGRPLFLVTHSMGGILARYIAGEVGEAAGLSVRGVLMLAPPNAGSRLARRLGGLRVFHRLYGPAGQELGAEAAAWPVPTVPVAVIAGTHPRGLNPTGWMSQVTGLIRGDEPSDGTVLVEETRLPGMVDFATVPASHTFIMDHPRVREMVLRFLRDGRLG